jgi:1-acyl-sn-glycerol-3-phosphate acyltransferase
MTGSKLRAFIRLVVWLALTLPLMPVQALLLIVSPRLAELLPHWYHRITARIFGIRVETFGAPSAMRPTLFVSNHVSYVDITVMSAVMPISFIAKREVAAWPFFGWLAKLQRTVFVDRSVTVVDRERDLLARHLAARRNLVLFPEGTSSDGTGVKRFRSSLLAAAERTPGGIPLLVQPITIAYTRLDDMPLGRHLRPFYAWYGDMDLVDHLWMMLGIGRVTATIVFHEPVTFARFGSRKALTKHCEEVIADALWRLNAGRAAAS